MTNGKSSKLKGEAKDMAKVELEYVEVGDYLIPAMTIGGSALVESEAEAEEWPLGKYGLMRFRHLKDNNKFLYNLLEIRGQLDSHLREIDETARSRVESFIREALKKQPIPEELKNTDPMEWVGRMENLKAQAEEIVTRELIFA
jgi:hypothetical protein